jgi:hypothetical protein
VHAVEQGFGSDEDVYALRHHPVMLGWYPEQALTPDRDPNALNVLQC